MDVLDRDEVELATDSEDSIRHEVNLSGITGHLIKVGDKPVLRVLGDL